jgi:hypothetical protein
VTEVSVMMSDSPASVLPSPVLTLSLSGLQVTLGR